MEDQTAANEGRFVKLYVKIRDVWRDEWERDYRMYVLFTYCIMAARWVGGAESGVDVPKGSLLTSAAEIAGETGLNKEVVSRTLAKLSESGELCVEGVTDSGGRRKLLITVRNYGRYQGPQWMRERDAGSPPEEAVGYVPEEFLKPSPLPPERDVDAEGRAKQMEEPALAEYNAICKSYPRAKRMTKKASERLEALVRDGVTLDQIGEAFRKMEGSSMMRGGFSGGGMPNMEWMLNPENFHKILSGEYNTEEEKFEMGTVSGFFKGSKFDFEAHDRYIEDLLEKQMERRRRKENGEKA